MRWGWVVAMLTGCADVAPQSPEPTWVDVALPSDRGSAIRARQDLALNLREEVFEVGPGASTPLVDFLFVVDNSRSMQTVYRALHRGVHQVVQEGAFPAKSQIAVTSTLPGNAGLPRLMHPSVRHAATAMLDPGFMGLVDHARIRRFRATHPELGAKRFPVDGCPAWFTPDARTESGIPCLNAHMQIVGEVYLVEAGLTAAWQLVQEGPLFRPGAAVNLIFVSDTHDPGYDHPSTSDLVLSRPGFAALSAAVARHHTVSSLFVHAAAPMEPCTNEAWDAWGPVYHDVAAESGGVSLDLCGAEPEDWVDMIRAMATDGDIVREPVLPLGVDADVVLSVQQAQEPVPFSAPPSGQVVVLDAMPTSRGEITVRLRPRVAEPTTSRTPRTSERDPKHDSDRRPDDPGSAPGAFVPIDDPSLSAEPPTRQYHAPAGARPGSPRQGTLPDGR